MPSVEARIATDRPSRYLRQFCTHAATIGDGHRATNRHMRHAREPRAVGVQAEWSDSRGVVTFTASDRCTLTAGTGVLIVRIDAADADSLRSIQRLVSDDFARFGRRDGLDVNWRECV